MIIRSALRGPRFAGPGMVLGFAALLTGCQHSSEPPLPVASPASVRASARPMLSSRVSALQVSPEYQALVRLFDRKQYSQARAGLDRLLAELNRTGEEKAFLSRQRALCEDALAGHSLKSSPAVSAPVSKLPARSADCGPRALQILCQQLGKNASLEALRKMAGTTRYGTTLEGLAKAAKAQGLKAAGVQMDGPALDKLSAAAVAWVDGDHYVAVLKVADGQVIIHDPNQPKEETLTIDTLLRRSGGILLTVTKQ